MRSGALLLALDRLPCHDDSIALSLLLARVPPARVPSHDPSPAAEEDASR